MEKAFDPYHKWLGIPVSDQPANHYRLLGIDLFESDPDVISNAADGRMAQVKSFATGKYGALSQRILNEIAAAKISLLDSRKKAPYDRQLQQRLPPSEGRPVRDSDAKNIETFDFAAAAMTRPSRSASSRAKKKSLAWLAYAAVVGGIAAVGAVALFFLLRDSSPANDGVAKAQRSGGGSDSKPDSATAARPEPRPQLVAAKSGDNSHQATDEPPLRADHAKSTVAAPEPKTEAVDDRGSENKPSLPVEPSNEPPDGKSTSAPRLAKEDVTNPAPEEKPLKAKRGPVPDKPLQQAAEAKIREIFRQEFSAAKTGGARTTLAQKLIEQAENSKDDAAARYVLLRLAGEQSVLCGNVVQAMAVIEKMQEKYEIDSANMKADVLAALSRQSAGDKSSSDAVFEAAMKLCDEAMSRDDFDLANRCVKTCSVAARKSRNVDANRLALARTHEIDRLKAKYAAVHRALETLQNDAMDSAANLVAGQWYCFIKGDWDKGLPSLAKGSRDDLADLARRDLARPAAAKEQVALGDGWWALAEKESSPGREALETRARYWYEQALPQLTGLDKAKAEKRLEAQQQVVGPDSTPMNSRRGVVQKGNIALGTNGTTAVANRPWLSPANLLFDGNSTHYGAADGYAATIWPAEWTITLNKVYLLQYIRLRLWDQDNRYYRYRVWSSSDGKRFSLVVDHSTGEWRSWQEIKFPARGVKFVKLECLYNSANENFQIVEFEAYCVPPTR